jgi:hypothetical protein
LKEILNSLNLHEDFLNKIIGSTRQTAARLMRTDAEPKLEHIHLLVFAPSKRTSNNQTWGFFSVERLENKSEDDIAHDHTVEIYLYVEGDEIPTHGNK